MELLDVYYRPDTIDRYTFVFDEVTPETGYHTMLALSEDGRTFSQWTSGLYDPEGGNEHLGERVVLRAIGARALDGFFARLSIPRDWEGIHETVERIIREAGDA